MNLAAPAPPGRSNFEAAHLNRIRARYLIFRSAKLRWGHADNQWGNRADGWLSVSGLAATVAGGGISTGTITVNPNGFAPGYYRSNIRIDTSAGTANLPVTVLVASTAFITLNPGGQLFQMSQGGAVGNPNGSFAVTVQGTAVRTVQCGTASQARQASANTRLGQLTVTTPGTVSFSVSPSVASLAPKVYYGTIRVTSTQTANSPQDFLVVLKVGNSNDPVTIDHAMDWSILGWFHCVLAKYRRYLRGRRAPHRL